MSWRIRYSSDQVLGFLDGHLGGPMVPGITPVVRHAHHWSHREAAVAFVLKFVHARIVDTAAELSTTEPTCFIEEVS